MKTNHVKLLAKSISICSFYKCTYDLDENPKTNQLEYIEFYCKTNRAYFGIYFHKTYVEFWINDTNDDDSKDSVRYIFRCSEIDCIMHIREAIDFGYKRIIKEYKDQITDKL
jgi:hypothetical protein